MGVPISTAGRAKRASNPPDPSLPASRLLMVLTPDKGVSTCGTVDSQKSERGEMPGQGRNLDVDSVGTERTLLDSMREALGPGFDLKTQVRTLAGTAALQCVLLIFYYEDVFFLFISFYYTTCYTSNMFLFVFVLRHVCTVGHCLLITVVGSSNFTLVYGIHAIAIGILDYSV